MGQKGWNELEMNDGGKVLEDLSVLISGRTSFVGVEAGRGDVIFIFEPITSVQSVDKRVLSWMGTFLRL